MMRLTREAMLELRRHVLRTLLTAIGVSVAVAAFTLIAQVGELARREFVREFAGVEGTPGTVGITAQTQQEPLDPVLLGKVRAITTARLARYGTRAASMATGVGDLRVGTDSPPVRLHKDDFSCGPAARGGCSVAVWAVDLDIINVMNGVPLAGRWLEPSDDASLGVPVVLSDGIAKSLIDVDHPSVATLVGSTLHPTDGPPVVVVGVLKDNAIVRLLGDPGVVLVAPGTGARLDAVAPRHPTDLRAFALAAPNEARPVGRRVAADVDRFVAGQGVNDRSVEGDRVDQAGELAKAKRILNLVMAGIAGVTMVVGALFVLIIALTSLRQRVQELGVRRAIGARPRDLAGLLLLESTAVAMIGGVLGVGFAWVVAQLVIAFTPIEDSIDITAPPLAPLLLGLLVAAGTGVLAGLIPAWRAARLPVLDALRR